MNIELIVNQEDALAFGREFGGLPQDSLEEDQVAFVIDPQQGSRFVLPRQAGRSWRQPTQREMASLGTDANVAFEVFSLNDLEGFAFSTEDGTVIQVRRPDRELHRKSTLQSIDSDEDVFVVSFTKRFFRRMFLNNLAQWKFLQPRAKIARHLQR
ncbi:hypothetical protein [Vreelandella aquamarina]|jgi:hypothetical protein|uniref:Uncharacterized protein n=1 Tax=Vreelandella aquamarina TaxID=77097 RepID=A0A1N6EPS9_9GAMM|nr:hypothetical protein [Halomonas meridiana]MCC4289261.1 hypothetical protein [Halomonas meridiana]SIN85046.1 hypothetical protein SAMN05878249_3794 [Halomonas meridiana]SIN87545.1 hypothetical protein SAMN05878438_3753 [Halomonas meridiana]SIO51441.1 hypothetical protein SAMN05878442_3823 [Halomonas meridiana]GED46747.1 hypothetical protein HME01_25990 [Halomonas meridiana]